MSGKSQPMSTFTIRYNPISVVDDDDDELYNFESTRPRKEVLQFERRSASPPPAQDVVTNSVDSVEADASTVGNGVEPAPALHPGTLWKTPLQAVRSAPVSEATSPVTPTRTATPTSEDKNPASRGSSNVMAREDSQRSLFSELRERIVNQSREILPKRLNKTGSADTAKIITAPEDFEKNAIEKEMKVLKSRSRPGSDAGEALAKEILKAGSTECISDWDKLSDSEECIKRSSSTGRISSKPETSAGTELPSASEVAKSHSAAPVMSMSELKSSISSESLTSDTSDATAVTCELMSPKTTPPEQKPEPAVVILPTRSLYLNYLPQIPGFAKKQSVVTVFVLFLALVLLPLPPFVSGFAIGSFLTGISCVIVYVCFFKATREKTAPPPRDLQSLPALVVPEMKESKNTDGLFKGWMNELSDYDVNDYHLNQTHSVFVTLEGSTMRLQTPKQGIAKRAIWDESVPSTVSFVRQKHYDLRGCEVRLLPANLIEKRLWSKKYPICLEILKRTLVEPQDRSGVRDFMKRNSYGRVEPEPSTSDQLKDSKTGAQQMAKGGQQSPTLTHLKQLYLFARSSREKEEWFRRFIAASAETPWPTRMSDLIQKSSSSGFTKTHNRAGSGSSIELQPIQRTRHGSTDSQCNGSSVDAAQSPEVDYSKLPPEKNLVEYMSYMAKIMPATDSSLKGLSSQSPSIEPCDPQLLWLNAVISRCFLDFLREKYWTNKIRDKIQKKLGKMHVPHFIDQLTVTGIELGPQVPVICRTSKPYLDDRGLWVDLDVSYAGGFGITMETKCNLMKLKSAPSATPQEKHDTSERSGALYSDEEDSAESTTDEEAVEENSSEDANSDRRSEPMSKKLLKFVDKISKSRYFQQATDYRYIKKAMEEVSNTRLILNVEMKSVVGTLAVNIPPPPTNRIWYGFRGNPNLVLSAKPRVGEREVSLSHITDWIEKKLAVEFQRVFVMPNMDDIPIPLMCEHLPVIVSTTVEQETPAS